MKIALRTLIFVPVSLALFIALSGCRVSHPDLNPVDSGTDGESDAALDVAMDSDRPLDAPLDAFRDSAMDAELDAPEDAADDISRDTAMDVPEDVPEDSPADSPPDSEPDACVPADEIGYCDGFDDDCDGEDELFPATGFYDSDGDGFGGDAATPVCPIPDAITVSVGGDCDDTRADFYPGAPETCEVGDWNCDGRRIPCGCESRTYAGKEYLFCTEPSRTWQQAEDFCNGEDGHLVAVGSEDEQEWLVSVATGGRWWLGANDIDDEGEYVWSNGEPFDYNAWTGPEPNNHGGGQDCAVIEYGFGYMGAWNDTPCSGLFAHICERDAAPE